ncbi:hypothetical protein BC936DRAFT_145592 [Jimgerdemannia flammicorona]|uniref:Uncharacterized protein n=1 Tax=Jimgerdemannia flammicorona TaxID=994334 RepID=A0A433D9L1_9FUNG|nr:hypothetical protein BC936DRAFT_145592 [Jimgerdemannia flammicorona]
MFYSQIKLDGSEEGELVNDFEVIESISKTSLHDDRFYAVKEEICLVVQHLSSALTSCKATSANSPLRPCTIIAIRGKFTSPPRCFDAEIAVLGAPCDQIQIQL